MSSLMVDNASRLALPYAGRTLGMPIRTIASCPIKLLLCGAPDSENAASSERHKYGQLLRSADSRSKTLPRMLKNGMASRQARCFGAANGFGNEGLQDLTGPTMVNSGGPNPLASCLCINRTILKGEIVEHSGVIIVKGNVNSGAAIHAHGDIIILGNLEGEAHAGRNGDTCAIVFASHFKPTTIGIAGSISHRLYTAEANVGQIASLFSDGEIRIRKAVDQSFKFLPVGNGDSIVVKEQTVGMPKGGEKAWFEIYLNSMRKPSRVAFFTGAYILIVGIALFLFPEPLFGFFF